MLLSAFCSCDQDRAVPWPYWSQWIVPLTSLGSTFISECFSLADHHQQFVHYFLSWYSGLHLRIKRWDNFYLPKTHFMISNSVHENWVVFTLNICLGWSVMVSLGRFFTPSNRSEAFTTNSPRKIVKETACATNFMKGLRRIRPSWKENVYKTKVLLLFSWSSSHVF